MFRACQHEEGTQDAGNDSNRYFFLQRPIFIENALEDRIQVLTRFL